MQGDVIFGQQKKCEFINAHASFRVQDLSQPDPQTGEDVLTAMALITLENLDFDESQDQVPERFIEINEDLVLLKYFDDDQNKVGLLFFYPQDAITYYIEGQKDSKDMQVFEVAICELIFALHKKKDPVKSRAHKEEVMSYSILTNMRQIFERQDLYWLFDGDKPTEEQPKKIDPRKMQEAQKKEERLKDEDFLVQSLEKLALSDSKPFQEIAVNIEERLLQVRGNLFVYDGEADTNFLLKADCFLAVDRLGAQPEQNRSYRFMFNVTDQAQMQSFTRIEIKTAGSRQFNFSFSLVDKILMWMGDPVEMADEVEIPCYSFVLTE